VCHGGHQRTLVYGRVGRWSTLSTAETAVAQKSAPSGAPPRLHLGCGLNTPDGWIHVDGSLGAWLAKHPILKRVAQLLRMAPRSQFEIPWDPDIVVHDVRKRLPFSDASMTAVYSSHLLEHLYLDEAQRLLAECRRVLVPGGVLRLVVPVLRAIVREYLVGAPIAGSDYADASPADRLNRRLLLRPPGLPKRSFLYRWYSANEFHTHKWMYDAESLIDLVRSSGFDDVEQRPLHDSCIDGIEQLESPSRVCDGAGVCVEAIRPIEA
jgi:SAM-dependent methyltransferase